MTDDQVGAVLAKLFALTLLVLLWAALIWAAGWLIREIVGWF